MSALGWITTGQRLLAASLLRRRGRRRLQTRVSTPALEALETIELLSGGLSRVAAAHQAAKEAKAAKAATAAQVVPFASETVKMNATTATMTQTTQVQTATVPSSPTPIDQEFTPAINLFDPTLGTLESVTVTGSATLSSQISAQNTSTTSGANITGFVQGTFSINGLDQTITGSLPTEDTPTVSVAAYNGEAPFTGASSVTFAPISTTVPASANTTQYTAASDLAFFTASAGRTTISPTLVATAAAGANAPNANLRTSVSTSGSGTVTVTYTYMPTCPPVTNVVRYGIHRQPTQIQVTFGGTIPAGDANPAYYTITAPNSRGSFTGPGTKTIPITSAVLNAANNTVTLTTAKQLNVHYLNQLEVNLPCDNGNPTVIEFGSKMSLGGFTNPHTGAFIPVVDGVPQYPNGPGPFPK